MVDREGAYSPAYKQSRKRLQQVGLQQIIAATLCRFDDGNNFLYMDSFGYGFKISFPEGEIFYGDSDGHPSIDWGLILLNYLSSAQILPLAGEWVSYRELPQGNVFFPSIRTYVLEALARFIDESSREILCQAILELGFEFVTAKADLAAKGFFAPRVPILLQYWEGEDEIRSSCQILFDRTAADQMHIEDIAALCGTLRDLIVMQYEQVCQREL